MLLRLNSNLRSSACICGSSSGLIRSLADADFVAHRDFRAAAVAADVGEAEGEEVVVGAAVGEVHDLALEGEVRLDAVRGRRDVALGAAGGVELGTPGA